MNRIQKIENDMTRLDGASSFSVIGDPGCEGMGTSMMKVYANALRASAYDDFILIAGDFVPEGEKRHYRTICGLTEAVSEQDVYALRGNHDTGEYERYFGKKNYALICEEFTLVVLDNAARTFLDEGLELLGRVLAAEECRRAVIAFHIPLPNHYIGNSVSQKEFDRLIEVYAPWRHKVSCFVCGHVHSRFEDLVDGIPMICTGGGGAMIEDVSEEIRAEDVDHHIVRFWWDGEKLDHQIVNLDRASYKREMKHPILREKLSDAVQAELCAHLRYLNFAERADRRGFTRIGNLFRALAESEYRHARSFFSILDEPEPFAKAIAGFLPGEEFEYQNLYRMMSGYAGERNLPLSRQAFGDAAAAEKVHARLLRKAEDLDHFEVSGLSVCTVCGYVMEGADIPSRCPVCGAPKEQFARFEA